MSYLCYLCLFAHSGVQHIIVLSFCFTFLRLVYPMLPVSVNCQFVIAPSVFSNVYLNLYGQTIYNTQYYISINIGLCYWVCIELM
jgi:hypothetical protein